MGMPVVATSPCCYEKPTPPANCHCFAAQNGTAEVAAAGRYAGKILLASVAAAQKDHNGTYCPYPWTNHSCRSQPEWNEVVPGVAGTVAKFSAICWYTGIDLFASLGGKVPVGLITGAVGGSPIEFWLPPGHVNDTEHCGVDAPPCDNGGKNGYHDSDFWEQLISPFAPYTLGTVVWDQGERDAHCLPQADGTTTPENHVARYGCMLRSLLTSWRAAFGAANPFQFYAVQLPGYLGDCGDYQQCSDSVFPLRLQQQEGIAGLDTDAAAVSVTPTYDLSCPPGVDSTTRTTTCPFGSVHNVFKRQIGARLASQIMAGIARRPSSRNSTSLGRSSDAAAASTTDDTAPPQQQQWPGPGLVGVNASRVGNVVTVWVTYDVPLAQAPTLNCVACCSKGDVGDFDTSFDHGQTWVNGSRPVIDAGSRVLRFTVAAPAFTVSKRAGRAALATPSVTHIRYTGNQPFPQCAVFAAQQGKATGIPAMPFRAALSGAEYI